MASLTQTVVDKDMPNPLIAEGLLKILRDLILSSPPNSLLSIPVHEMVRPQNDCNCLPCEIIIDQTYHVNIIPLAYPTVKLTLYL